MHFSFQLRGRISDIQPPMDSEYYLNDLNLLRFIRARKSVDKAEIMFRKVIVCGREQRTTALVFLLLHKKCIRYAINFDHGVRIKF